MSEAWPVTLPKQVPPVFREQCLDCGKPTKEKLKLLQQESTFWAPLLTPAAIFMGWSSFRAPFCRRCRWIFRAQHYGWLLLLFAAGALGLWVVYAWFPNMNGNLQKLILVGLFLLVGYPLLLLRNHFPPPLAVQIRGTLVDYLFRSEAEATEFEDLNSDYVIGRIE
jgi:hypothetical protein